MGSLMPMVFGSTRGKVACVRRVASRRAATARSRRGRRSYACRSTARRRPERVSAPGFYAATVTPTASLTTGKLVVAAQNPADLTVAGLLLAVDRNAHRRFAASREAIVRVSVDRDETTLRVAVVGRCVTQHVGASRWWSSSTYRIFSTTSSGVKRYRVLPCSAHGCG